MFSWRSCINKYVDELADQDFVVPNEWLVRIDGINDLDHAGIPRSTLIPVSETFGTTYGSSRTNLSKISSC